MAEEIGGYFARLRLVVAQDDFNQGMRSLILLDAQIRPRGIILGRLRMIGLILQLS